jgi:hypothetical protein
MFNKDAIFLFLNIFDPRLIESTDVEHMYMGFVNISVLIFEVNKNQ